MKPTIKDYTNDCLCRKSGFICFLLPLSIVFSIGIVNLVRELEAVGFYVGITSPRLEGQ